MSWYVTVAQYVPQAHDRTQVRTWSFRSPLPVEDQSWLHYVCRRYLEFVLPPFLAYYTRKIAGEDHAVCEKIQSVAGQIDGDPILGREEERIAWFEDAYAREVMYRRNEHPYPLRHQIRHADSRSQKGGCFQRADWPAVARIYLDQGTGA